MFVYGRASEPIASAPKKGEIQTGLSIGKEHRSESEIILRAFVCEEHIGGAALNLWGYIPVRCPPDAAFLADIKVNPFYRNRGIGGELIDSAIAIAHLRGFRRVVLEVAPWAGESAVCLYKSKGFVEMDGNPLGINKGPLMITRSITDELRGKWAVSIHPTDPLRFRRGLEQRSARVEQ